MVTESFDAFMDIHIQIDNSFDEITHTFYITIIKMQIESIP